MVQVDRSVLLCSAVVVALCVYLQHTGYRPFQSQDRIEAHLNSYAAAAQPADVFIVYAGRTFFLIATTAWAVLIVQALFHAVRRYRYTPSAVPALQPVNPDEHKPQHKAISTATAATTTAAAAGPCQLQPTPTQHQQQTNELSTEQQQQQRQSQAMSGRVVDLDERRRRAAEARQKQLDEAAAAHREQQLREEAQRQQRAAQAAAVVAAHRRQQEEARQASQAVSAQQWAQWEQAVIQHYRRDPGSASNDETVTQQTQSGTADEAANRAAAAAAQRVEEGRQLRQQQDQEYQVSLAADQKQQQQKLQRQLLQHLKQLLQHSLPAEPQGAAQEGLTVRVKLPDGTTAVRQFVTDQPLADVYEWVFSLPTMPCLAPGSWSLSTTFPKQSLLPPRGFWSRGSGNPDNQQLHQYIQQKEAAMGDTAARAAADDVWRVNVRQLSGDELLVLVQDESTVLDVKRKIELITGIPLSSQRIIFSGHIIPDAATLQQLGITAQHTLQLAAGTAAQQQANTAQSAGSEQQDLADSGGVLSSDSSNLSDVLELSDVQQLRQCVAHGAPQLTLYVVTQ